MQPLRCQLRMVGLVEMSILDRSARQGVAKMSG